MACQCGHPRTTHALRDLPNKRRGECVFCDCKQYVSTVLSHQPQQKMWEPKKVVRKR